jgi:hypothetical protein
MDDYEYQITDSGCIVRDSRGNIVIMTETEDEAREYMAEEASSSSHTDYIPKISPYDQFDNYTKGLKGKMYFDDGTFGSCFINPLKRFAKSFEKITEYRVEISYVYMGGELFGKVEEVY